MAVAFGLTGDRDRRRTSPRRRTAGPGSAGPQISRYDNPPAWVYRVTVNLARSRWRNLRVAAAHLVRQRPADVPAADPEHVALVTALRALPADQRQAIVLHHLVDLPVAEVARQMGVPAGTVKSWLHRGRTELAALLGEHSGGDGGPRRRRRTCGDAATGGGCGGRARWPSRPRPRCVLVAVCALQAGPRLAPRPGRPARADPEPEPPSPAERAAAEPAP